MSLVVVDADVLGRERTGDETYALNLLRELPGPAAEAGLRVAAVTRHPELVPAGIEPIELAGGLQELRMAWTLPRMLRRLGAALVHTQYAHPLRSPCPCVVTIHDLSFERDPTAMGWRDRLIFRTVVPRAARRAVRVLTVSERSRRDLVELYGLAEEKVVVTPNGVDPAFTPGAAGPASPPYALAVGAVQARKNQRAALAAAHENGLELVVAGPVKEQRIADELLAAGARLEGYVPLVRLVELYRGASCLIQTSRYEGFGLPVVEAMACGIPVVCIDEPALREVAAAAAVVVAGDELAAGVATALAERARLVSAGLERAKDFSWARVAEATVAVYREALAR